MIHKFYAFQSVYPNSLQFFEHTHTLLISEEGDLRLDATTVYHFTRVLKIFLPLHPGPILREV